MGPAHRMLYWSGFIRVGVNHEAVAAASGCICLSTRIYSVVGKSIQTLEQIFPKLNWIGSFCGAMFPLLLYLFITRYAVFPQGY